MADELPPEVWLRGPIEGFDPFVLPVAHSLLQAKEELHRLASTTPPEQVWQRPGGAASVGFHVQHAGGSVDRLLTYARGESLDAHQLATLRSEEDPDAPHDPLARVVAGVMITLDKALDQLRTTPRETLLEARTVGRKGLPSTVLGLFVHVAEHTTRHVGQAVTTAKLIAAR